MSSGNDENDEVEIISTHDEKVKIVGEILSNDSSRKILNLLNGSNELTLNEISQKTGLSLSLVAHHLKRMQSAEVVKVSRVGRSVKGQKMNYYSATNQSFLIVPSKEPETSIKSSLKKFSKFAAIGLAGVVSWMTLKSTESRDMIFSEDTSSDAADLVVSDESEEEWDAAYQTSSDSDLTVTTKDEFLSAEEPLEASTQSEPKTEPEPTPEHAPEPSVEEQPSHSGVQDFADSDAGTELTGSITLDRTVYPEPYGLTSADSAEIAAISIIIPIAVVVAGIILERVLTRWYRRRKIKNQES